MTAATAPRPRVAVVGAGVSGLTAAYLLSRTHDVTLLESDGRLGGHAHTHDVTASGGDVHAVDSGFIVHNDRTYPYLRKLFAELDVDVQPTEMSMSIACEECGLEYAGGRGLGGMFAQRRRVADPRFLAMLTQVKRFHRKAAEFLAAGDDTDTTTYGQWLRREGFSEVFIGHFAIPVVACVWSSGQELSLEYPARYLFRFLDHHGMLAVKGSPQWFTVTGGSRTYVERLGERLTDVKLGHGAKDIRRTGHGVEIFDTAGNVHHADKVVIATHPDTALSLLADPTDDEVLILKSFEYSQNETLLHTDDSILPGRASSSWNYRMGRCDGRGNTPVVSYWMNHLQRLDASDEFVVTLNARERIDPDKVIATMHYEHPIYTADSVAAQRLLPTLATDTTVYAGAYHGWGFHEDGCRSGVEAARHFGVDW